MSGGARTWIRLCRTVVCDRKSNMKEGRRHPFYSEFSKLSREFPSHQAFDAQPTQMVGGQACLKLSCEDFSYAFRVDAVSADASVAGLAGLGACGTREAASAHSEIFAAPFPDVRRTPRRVSGRSRFDQEASDAHRGQGGSRRCVGARDHARR